MSATPTLVLLALLAFVVEGPAPRLPPEEASAEAGDLTRLELKERAKAFATHTAGADEFWIGYAIDGDLATHWVGEGHPLTEHPTSIVIEFQQPTTVARLVLVSEIFRDRLALKDLDVYAWADTNWAGAQPLARIRGARDERTVIDFAPVTTTRLRIRILDNWREDHTYPRLREMEVYSPLATTPGRRLTDAPIPDEKASERVLVRRAAGEKIVYPGEAYDPAKGYLHYVQACLNTLISEGTDRYGSVQSPMFASLLDIQTHRIPDDTPPPVPGQRSGDRAVRGGNLFHDVMMLQACDLVTKLTQDAKYEQAATAYLTFFLEQCPQRTGLFPWGEHAHWDFFREAPAHATHEFLGGVPAGFWDRVWALSPNALHGEARGLVNHVVDLDTFDFDRHADIRDPLPIPRPRGRGFLDFPRHAGFYINVWTAAYAKTGETCYLDWSRGMIDHSDRSCDPKSGLPPASTRTERTQTIAVELVLSLSVSLLEASQRLSAGPDRDRYESVAKAYLGRILELPHPAGRGQFLVSFRAGSARPELEITYSSPYRYEYGGGFTADSAVLLLAVYRLTGDERALRLAEGCADYYAQHDPPPPWEIVRAHTYASILGLYTDLYDLRKRPEHLAQAERYGQLAIERLFWRGLFRGATSIDHYEGDLMVGNLVYNLAWLHALQSGSAVKVPPNYFNR